MLYKDTDTRVTRGGRTRRSSKNSICFFYPPGHHCLFTFPPHQITSLLPSLLFSVLTAQAQQRPGQRGRAVHFIHALPSLRRRPVSASKNHFDRRGRGFRCSASAIAAFRPLPSWSSAAVGLQHAKQSKAISRYGPYHETPTAAFSFRFV